jgi:hypothetical protein
MPYNALDRPGAIPGASGRHQREPCRLFDIRWRPESGGDGPCSDELYTTAIANFNTLERPLVWLPGDNDWTDCCGRYGSSQAPFFDPLERLTLERLLFASTDQSLGKKTLTLTRQSAEGGLYALYSEDADGSTKALRTRRRSAREGC